MKTAKFIKTLDGFNGEARLYKLSESVRYSIIDRESDHLRSKRRQTRYVIVSAISDALFGTETYIFPATSKGKIKSWRELPGSTRGVYNHEEVLLRAGYRVE